jgi:signal transduction histidine kinase
MVDDKKILLSVVDTGIGMAPDTVNKIFHKFSRADEASKFHTGGSGLGLYVAKEILKKHNGRIWAESDGLGKGSRFYLELEAV